MTFSSLPFFLFSLLVVIVYAVSVARYRWMILLVASWFFYGCLLEPHLLAILAIVTGVSYYCGVLIADSACPSKGRKLLYLGICSNVALLVAVKYLPVLLHEFQGFSGLFPTTTQAMFNSPIITIGVSYYVFQGISYLVDVYYETLVPERHLGKFALFMSFFPKILQGPIERGGMLLPQLQTLKDFNVQNVRIGLNLFLWGLFKKVVIADRIAAFIDPFFSHPHDYSPLSLLVAVYLFAFQIYYDFSGYTDMALGIARCFNICLTQNFNAPYASTSIAEFWRRWHISFSSWILDYIFKPLQMRWRDVKVWGTPLALMVAFLISGIWHGAGLNYVIWGGLHGVYLCTNVLLGKRKQKMYKRLGWEKSHLLVLWKRIITFHLVCLAWIFFRFPTVSDALYVVTSIPMKLLSPGFWTNVWSNQSFPDDFMQGLFVSIGLVICATVLNALGRRWPFSEESDQSGGLSWIDRLPAVVQGLSYGVLLYVVLLHGKRMDSFIYMQF